MTITHLALLNKISVHPARSVSRASTSLLRARERRALKRQGYVSLHGGGLFFLSLKRSWEFPDLPGIFICIFTFFLPKNFAQCMEHVLAINGGTIHSIQFCRRRAPLHSLNHYSVICHSFLGSYQRAVRSDGLSRSRWRASRY